MNFCHAGIDYKNKIDNLPKKVHDYLEMTKPGHFFPFNPVVTSPKKSVRLAFFGLNAYCAESDFPEELPENFLVWCASSYNKKLFNVLRMYREGIDPGEKNAFYYSNFVKAVLKQSRFKGEDAVRKWLRDDEKTCKLFSDWATKEIETLAKEGCRFVICFGVAAYELLSKSKQPPGITLIKERHFSRYYKTNTARIISEINAAI